MPTADMILPGRDQALPTSQTHFVNGRPLKDDGPDDAETIYVGMGCFWGVERLFWEKSGVWVTAVGYQAGTTPNPTYQEVCTGLTGHNETVRIVFRPAELPLERLLQMFWEHHDPTQGMRQGNDAGTQYRSGIYTTTQAQFDQAIASRDMYAAELERAGRSSITTEILEAPTFYYAEEYHQQYLAKNPDGYCNMKGAGVACPLPQSVRPD
ncbi:MAG: peptide-methionine (S)-S-oxide reductase MsrA [Ahrensia sp.]|nr:peptide-methionine (S)-S-oxide reductase MsrA [Ahrensia sp.]